MNSLPLRHLIAFLALICSSAAINSRAAETYHEQWRPQFHFTPATNWMNDPNGMVFYDGEYHLFYQYNPFGNKWGHMSWGHAVSKDLVSWEHLPIALYEENDIMIFSGSAVVDWKNTTGFGRNGKPPLVAIYTGHYTKKPLQDQQLAYSNDRGRTWTKYAGNPVLDIGEKDFRDPKVFWHEPTQRWVMAVAWPLQRQVRFYSSPNLKNWTHLSDFGPAGSIAGIWECPDLFPLAVEGKRRQQKWALIVNVGSGAPAGGSGCQYFVGDFDGIQFTPTRATNEPALWADWGRDFYAAVSWSDIPKRDGRRLWLGWMSNWEYANDVPTSPWRSAMSIPRELSLRETPEGLRLVQQPVRELEKLRGKRHRLGKSTVTEANKWLKSLKIGSDLLEIAVEFEFVPNAGEIELRIATGMDEDTIIRCQLSEKKLTLDRTRTRRVDFSPKFKGRYESPLRLTGERLRLHFFLDTSSVEVFADDGELSLTSLILPEGSDRRIHLEGSDSGMKVKTMEIWPLKSAVR